MGTNDRTSILGPPVQRADTTWSWSCWCTDTYTNADPARTETWQNSAASSSWNQRSNWWLAWQTNMHGQAGIHSNWSKPSDFNHSEDDRESWWTWADRSPWNGVQPWEESRDSRENSFTTERWAGSNEACNAAHVLAHDALRSNIGRNDSISHCRGSRGCASGSTCDKESHQSSSGHIGNGYLAAPKAGYSSAGSSKRESSTSSSEGFYDIGVPPSVSLQVTSQPKDETAQTDDEWESGEDACSLKMDDVDDWGPEDSAECDAEVLLLQKMSQKTETCVSPADGTLACHTAHEMSACTRSATGLGAVDGQPLSLSTGDSNVLGTKFAQLGIEKRNIAKSNSNALLPVDSACRDSDSEEDWKAISREALRAFAIEEMQASKSVHTRCSAEHKKGVKFNNSLECVELDACSKNTSSPQTDRKTMITNTCVRCGAEVSMGTDFTAEFGVLFCCEMAHRECLDQRSDPERQFYVQCCALCGESHVVSMDFTSIGINFTCRLIGSACGADTSKDICLNAAGDSCDGATSVQYCSTCGTCYTTELDLSGLGINFECCLIGRQCWDMAEELQGRDDHELALGGDAERKSVVMSLVEQQRLLAKFGNGYSSKRGYYQAKLERDHYKQELTMQAGAKEQRYRDSAVVTTRGERFITVGSNAPICPGTQLGGIIGSSSRGRLGLGLRKMSKEDAEKFSLSNRERGHLKKRVAHAKNQHETICFETKGTMHQLTHAAILPSSVVR